MKPTVSKTIRRMNHYARSWNTFITPVHECTVSIPPCYNTLIAKMCWGKCANADLCSDPSSSFEPPCAKSLVHWSPATTAALLSSPKELWTNSSCDRSSHETKSCPSSRNRHVRTSPMLLNCLQSWLPFEERESKFILSEKKMPRNKIEKKGNILSKAQPKSSGLLNL